MKWQSLAIKKPPFKKKLVLYYLDSGYRHGQVWAMQEFLGFVGEELFFKCGKNSELYISDCEDIYWFELPDLEENK